VEKVWATCQRACSRGVHVEITTLVIPGVNDSDESLRGIAGRIATQIGRDVPWHVTGYYPAHQFTTPPTPAHTLERAWQIGRDVGLSFVYVGNVPGHRFDNTYCPSCGSLPIRRVGYDVRLEALRDGRCAGCSHEMPGVWN
jgi:pyruvate formate lyase activating enzyme